MSRTWSTFIQRPQTLYTSRALRFSDDRSAEWLAAFGLEDPKNILEIGCGPGALCGSLKRWYPDAAVAGLDLDAGFLDYARAHVKGVSFTEGDIASLPFESGSFDAVLSNTVAEHVEPSAFFGEQLRILKPGGVCVVMSVRYSAERKSHYALRESDLEKDVWERVSKRMAERSEKFGVCRYPMDKAEYPAAMAKFGFKDISVGYVFLSLTPDDPTVSRERAVEMIESFRANDVDSVLMLNDVAPDIVTRGETAELVRQTEEKYAERLAAYDRGEKLWDCANTLIMVMRGIK